MQLFIGDNSDYDVLFLIPRMDSFYGKRKPVSLYWEWIGLGVHKINHQKHLSSTCEFILIALSCYICVCVYLGPV
jgi:hypothetical protein